MMFALVALGLGPIPLADASIIWILRRYWRRGENERDMLCLPVN